MFLKSNNQIKTIQIEENPGNWSMIKEAIPNTKIYAQDWNNEFQNAINNANPSGLAGASETIEAMQQTLDPYPDSIPQLTTSLRQDMEELRYQLCLITGEEQWYIPPISNLKDDAIGIVTGGDLHNHLGLTTDPIDGGGAPINTDAIVDNAIVESKIASNAITTTKIEDEAVIESKIAIDAVTTDKVKDQAITRSKIADSVFNGNMVGFQYFEQGIYILKPANEIFIPLTFEAAPMTATVNDGFEVGFIWITPKRITNSFIFEGQVSLSNYAAASHLIVMFTDDTAGEILTLEGMWNNDWGTHILTLRAKVNFPDQTLRKISFKVGSANLSGDGYGADLKLNYITGSLIIFTATEIETE